MLEGGDADRPERDWRKSVGNVLQTHETAVHAMHSIAKPEDKGYIEGWFDGASATVLHEVAFCAEPPASGASSNCEIGAPSEEAPRPGPIPTIYAIAAAGFAPDPSTVAWFNTVNIRVFSPDAWNQIAAAKTLAKVRELQGDPNVGTPGVISADTPTNIYFFIAILALGS